MAVCPLTRDEVLDMIRANDLHIVNAVRSADGIVITRNDGVQYEVAFPDIPDVDVSETDSDYIITVDDKMIAIPKCRRYRDCDGEVLDDCARIVTCEDLGSRGFLDAVVTEDVITGTGTTVDPVRFNCAAAELVPNPDNRQVLLCGADGVKKIEPSDLLAEMCFNDVPDLGDVCAVGEQLVLFNDDGCTRLGRVTTSSVRGEISEFADMVPALPENTAGYVLPQDFPVPNNVYTVSDYVADGGVDTARYPSALGHYRPAPGLNAARIQNSRLARFTGTLECARTFDWTFYYARGEDFTSYAHADGSRFFLGSRIRIRPEGENWSPWLYPFTPGPGTLALWTTFNGFEVRSQFEARNSFPAGDYEWEFFYVGAADPANNLSVSANTHRNNYATPGPRVSITPRIIA